MEYLLKGYFGFFEVYIVHLNFITVVPYLSLALRSAIRFLHSLWSFINRLLFFVCGALPLWLVIQDVIYEEKNTEL